MGVSFIFPVTLSPLHPSAACLAVPFSLPVYILPTEIPAQQSQEVGVHLTRGTSVILLNSLPFAAPQS